MVRKLSLALFLAANIPFGAWALGLGDIHARSALNQELKADIDLLSVKPGELDGLKVQLAAPEVFARAGVDRPYLLTRLRFTTERREDGSAVIRVTTQEAIREPFLNFLIEVNWPKGRMVREYTLLLDPPLLTDRRPAPISPPIEGKPAPRAVAPADARASAPVVAAGDYGPVRSNETLWAIADRLRPTGASVHQMMIALWRANPQAFANNNINRIKAGATLRVPDPKEVMVLAPQEALQEFRAQMAMRQPSPPAATPEVAAPAVPPPVIETAPAPTPPAAQPGAAAEPEAQLRLLTPRPEGAGEAGVTEGTADTVKGIRDELLLAREANASLRQESEDLRARTNTLEQQLADMQRLLTLTNEQLARLQSGLGQEGVPPQAVEPAPGETPAAKPAEVAATSAPPAEKPQVAREAPSAAKPVAETPPPAPKPGPAPKAADNLLQSLLSDPEKWPILGGAAGAVVLLLVFLLRRRKAKIPEFVATAPAAARAEEQEAERKRPGEAGVAATAAALESSFLTDYTPSGVDTLQDDSGEVDPVAEADVYIAYGRYQQAEELIRQAIERDPERAALKTKLLELHFANKDKTAFVALAEELSATGLSVTDPDAWKQVVAMGYELDPTHVLFAEHASVATGAGAGSTAPDDELDLDAMLDDDLKGLDLADLAADFDENIAGATATGDTTLDLDLDFDLDKAMQTGGTAVAGAPTADAQELGADLDLSAFEAALTDVPATEETQAVDDFELGEPAAVGERAQTLGDELATLTAATAPQEPAVEGLDLSDLEQSLSGAAAELRVELPTEDLLHEPRTEAELKELDDSFAGISLDEFMDEEEATVSQADFGVGGDADAFDEVGTKLDLARAYIEMGEQDGARSILNEVLTEGNEAQKGAAQELLATLT